MSRTQVLEKLKSYSLDNISKAFNKLGSYDFRTIHIAGTNGKGSVCTFLELLYLKLLPDIKIGKYTSPHIWNITERFSVNGEDISQEELEARSLRLESRLNKIELPASSLQLSKFEELTLLAFEYFKSEEVEIAILETGLGGRFDATNIIPDENRIATAITNISYDHMDRLGNSLEEIRREKEGIKRDDVPHFEGLKLEARSSKCEKKSSLQLPASSPNSVHGSNFLLAIDIFESINNIKVDEETKLKVLEDFPKRYRARLEYKDGVLLDAAHNQDSMHLLNQYISDLEEFDRKIFVVAFLDKDYRSSLEELFSNGVLNADRDLVIITELDSDRATPAFMLDEVIDANKMIIPNPQEAISKAKELKEENDLVVITGSIQLIAELKQA